MPVPTHFRFVFRGIFQNSPEAFSFGMHFSRDNPGGIDAGVGDINEGSVTSAVSDFFNNTNAKIPTTAKLMDWRAYQIGTDNKMEGNPLFVDTSGLSIDGAVSMVYPPQIALVVTTVGADRGAARFGRFYLPTGAAFQNDMKISAADALAVAEASSTFMKDVSNAIDLEALQSSEGLNISQVGVAGARQTIDHLEVGRVLDTLRSRRQSLVEARVSTGHIDW